MFVIVASTYHLVEICVLGLGNNFNAPVRIWPALWVIQINQMLRVLDGSGKY